MLDDEFGRIDGIGGEKSVKFMVWLKDDVDLEDVEDVVWEVIMEEEEGVGDGVGGRYMYGGMGDVGGVSGEGGWKGGGYGRDGMRKVNGKV